MSNRIAWMNSVAEALLSLDDPSWSYPKRTFYYNRLKKRKLVSKAGILRIISDKFFLKAPKDAEIFLRPEKCGIIIVAPSEKKVLKLFLDTNSVIQLDREIGVLKKINGTDFEKHTNKYVSSGSVGKARWLIVEFLDKKKTIDEYYLYSNNLSVMSKMQSFYRLYGTKVVTAEQWANSLTPDISKHPKANDLNRVKEVILSEVARVGNIDLVISCLHGDLHKENIIVTNDGEKIFDWEGTCEGLVLMDYFDAFRRFLNKVERNDETFWKYLRSSSDKLPQRYEEFYRNLKTWYHSQFGIELKSGQEKLLFLVFALERTCSLMRITPPRFTKDHIFEMKKILEII